MSCTFSMLLPALNNKSSSKKVITSIIQSTPLIYLSVDHFFFPHQFYCFDFLLVMCFSAMEKHHPKSFIFSLLVVLFVTLSFHWLSRVSILFSRNIPSGNVAMSLKTVLSSRCCFLFLSIYLFKFHLIIGKHLIRILSFYFFTRIAKKNQKPHYYELTNDKYYTRKD